MYKENENGDKVFGQAEISVGLVMHRLIIYQPHERYTSYNTLSEFPVMIEIAETSNHRIELAGARLGVFDFLPARPYVI
jgi:hypothetical protein